MLRRLPKPEDLAKIAPFLNFDGTLVHFDRPEDTVPFVDEDLRTRGNLHDACGGGLAIISGRALSVLEECKAFP